MQTNRLDPKMRRRGTWVGGDVAPDRIDVPALAAMFPRRALWLEPWSSIEAVNAVACDDPNRPDSCRWAGSARPVFMARARRGEPAPGYLAELEKCRGELERADDGGCTVFAASKRRRTALREEGEEVDVDRMLEDRSDCWRTSVRGRTAPVYRLGWQLNATCVANQAYFANVGACVAILADWLLVRGYSLEVVGVVVWGHSQCAQVETVPLVRPGEPLDIAAFGSVADQAATRRVFMERQKRELIDAYGDHECLPLVWTVPSLYRALGLDWLIGNSGPNPHESASKAVSGIMAKLAAYQPVEGAGV